MSEYQLKLALAEEIECALKWKKTYETATEEFLGLAKELLRYCEKNHAELRRDEGLRRRMVRMGVMILAVSDGSFQAGKTHESHDDFPVPCAWFCYFIGGFSSDFSVLPFGG